jgi:D-serine dehydratase
MENENSLNYLRQQGLTDEILSNTAQICWATGGRLVPDEIWNQYMNTYL